MAKNAEKPEAPTDVVTGESIVLPEETPEEEPALEVVPEKADPVTLSRFGLEEQHNAIFRCNVKPNVSPEQCMEEGFWTHISMHLTPGDTIVVRPDDSSWELVLHVVNMGPQFAHVVKKAFYELVPTTDLPPIPSIYRVEFAGTTHKWRFLREGKMMRDGFATRELAQRAAANHQAAVDR